MNRRLEITIQTSQVLTIRGARSSRDVVPAVRRRAGDGHTGNRCPAGRLHSDAAEVRVDFDRLAHISVAGRFTADLSSVLAANSGERAQGSKGQVGQGLATGGIENWIGARIAIFGSTEAFG